MKKNKISILAAGSMGLATAVLLNNNGHDIQIWTPIKEEAELLNTVREYKDRMPGVFLPEGIMCSNDFEETVTNADTVVFTVPAQKTRETAKRLKQCLDKGLIGKDTIIVTCSKGIEIDSCKVLSEVIFEEIPELRLCVLTGPTFAIELAKELPSTVVCASDDMDAAGQIQELFMNSYLRVYTISDMVGAELAGALKNVIAFAAGISEGLGFQNNTKAALMTRGLAEITRLGVAMGASKDTFSGLAGMGDMILTCTGEYSRNRKAGILVGQGNTVDEAIKKVNMVVEGVLTAAPAYKLAQHHNIEMPIIKAIYDVVYNGKNPRDAVNDLMGRTKRAE